MVDTTLAGMSDLLVGSAMVVYTLALLAYSADLGLQGLRRGDRRAEDRRASDRLAEQRSSELVTVGAPADAPAVADTAPPPVPREGRSRSAGIGTSLSWLGFVLHMGALLTRGLAVSRVPWGNMYEFALTGSAVMVAVYLGMVVRRASWEVIGVFVVGPVLLTLGAATLLWYTVAARLVPALQDEFLVIHVSIASLSIALFSIAFSAQILQLLRDRPGRARVLLSRLPSTERLEQVGYRLIAVSFPLWTFTLVAGAIWAEKAWGRYWGWDPKEVWTFVIWVVYAAYLHARATRGWDGRRATYLALAGFVCVIINFAVVNVYFVGEHSYAGIG